MTSNATKERRDMNKILRISKFYNVKHKIRLFKKYIQKLQVQHIYTYLDVCYIISNQLNAINK